MKGSYSRCTSIRKSVDISIDKQETKKGNNVTIYKRVTKTYQLLEEKSLKTYCNADFSIAFSYFFNVNSAFTNFASRGYALDVNELDTQRFRPSI